jgi:hypothetical protein
MARSQAHHDVMKRAKLPRLSKSPLVPKPQAPGPQEPPAGEEQRLDPTRYGDWEKNGVAVDF